MTKTRTAYSSDNLPPSHPDNDIGRRMRWIEMNYDDDTVTVAQEREDGDFDVTDFAADETVMDEGVMTWADFEAYYLVE